MHNYSQFICNQYRTLLEKVYNVSEITQKIWDIGESYHDGDMEIDLYFVNKRIDWRIECPIIHGEIQLDKLSIDDWQKILNMMEVNITELNLYLRFDSEPDEGIRKRISSELPQLHCFPYIDYRTPKSKMGNYLKFTLPRLH